MLDVTEVAVLDWLLGLPADATERCALELRFRVAEREPERVAHYSVDDVAACCGRRLVVGDRTVDWEDLVTCRACWLAASRGRLLEDAERDPVNFPPVLALALSGRWALPGEQDPGDLLTVIFDDLDEWEPLPFKDLVTMAADRDGDFVAGTDATYDRELVGAVVRGLLREGHLVEGEDGLRAPACAQCAGGGAGLITGAPCEPCGGTGSIRPKRSGATAPDLARAAAEVLNDFEAKYGRALVEPMASLRRALYPRSES